MAKSVGILTGGGDCPGLNAVIRAVVRRADAAGWDVVAVREGWRGLVEPIFEDLGPQQVSGILPRGGTIIGTSRTNPFKLEGAVERVLQNFSDRGLEALVAIGGEDTLGVAARLHAEHQLPVVGVPKTIDNDLSGTDYTFGFDTAVFIATEAIDRLHTTAESHNRVMVVEVMGRHAGWIALHAGMAGGANIILIPENPFDVDEVVKHVEHRFASGYSPIIVVSEGAQPKGGELTLHSG
ncbi:MAG TPA: ATP-dependent 6-phosphofructokinase, partial [Gaiellaceae bacterium]|nr:ATP-dependent 6-phosphofructokinase [Gaiellaceae bacterium]